MRGVVFTGNKQLELTSFPDPVPGPNDVVLEIKASGLCGSDLKFYRPPPGAAFAALGLRDAGEPIIAGHEPCGTVAALGNEVDPRSFKVGDRVMVYHYAGCNFCGLCRAGWTQMCEKGAIVYGLSGHGGHADYMKVPANTLVHLPAELSFSAGAAISCGTGTAYQALLRMNVSARDTIVIVGQGPVGQSATQLAAAMGARVIAVDISAERAKRASEFGAAHSVDSSSMDPLEAVRALTGGKGASRCMDTSGSAAGRLVAVRAAAPWAVVGFVGEGGDVTLNVSPDIMRKQLTILGSWTFTAAIQSDCARFIASKGVEVDKLFTDRWTLDRAAEAYKVFDAQAAGKAVFLQ